MTVERRLRQLLLLSLVAAAALVAIRWTGLVEWAGYRFERGRLAAQRETLAEGGASDVSVPARLVAATVSPGVVSINTYISMDRLAKGEVPPDGIVQDLLEMLPVQPEGAPELPDDEIHRLDDPCGAGGKVVPLGLGSGFIVDADRGHIVTCQHVIQGADRICVELADGRTFAARLLGADPRTDLAVIGVEARQIHALDLGDSDSAEVGDDVFAVGNPFSLSGSFSRGIISAKGRGNLGLAGIEYSGFIQTDAVINPGNSGGPLVNMRGEVLGVITAIASRSGLSEKVGFAIPSERLRRLLPSLVEGREIIRGYVGVQIVSVLNQRETAKALGWEDDYGVLVRDVLRGSPAEAAGLRAEDIIVEFDGEIVPTNVELMDQIAFSTPGRGVPVRVWRDGQLTELTVVVERQPEGFHTTGWRSRQPDSTRPQP